LRAVFKRKAGLSGLFLCAAAAVAIMTGVAASEPLAVEIISATAGYDQRTREPIVEYKLSRASQKLFAEMTEKNVGRKMELRIDGQPVVAAVIREPILGGSGHQRRFHRTADPRHCRPIVLGGVPAAGGHCRLSASTCRARDSSLLSEPPGLVISRLCRTLPKYAGSFWAITSACRDAFSAN
jgi:hypothetical protein